MKYQFLAVTFSTLLFSTLLFTNAQSQDLYDTSLYYQVEIPLDDSQILPRLADMGLPVDHGHKDEHGLITDLSGRDLNLMTDAGIEFIVRLADSESWYEQQLLSDPVYQAVKSGTSLQDIYDQEIQNYEIPANFSLGSMGGYLVYDEIVETLDQMHALYPGLVTEKFSIGQSYEGREIWTVWFGTDLEEDKPQAYYNSLIHAREPMSMTNLIYYFWWLLENYGEDEMATFLLNERHLAFTPVINPDGYEYNRSNSPNGGGMHRKNKRPNGTSGIGTDLNRNFGPYDFWNHPNGGSDTYPGSETYRGTAPFSEPETAAVRDFTVANDFRTSFNYHSYSNLLIYPYGVLQRQTIDAHVFTGYAIDMTAENNYEYGIDTETVGYNTRGAADDWFYGYEDGNPDGRMNSISMTPEVGSFSDGGFWPPSSRIIELSQDNMLSNLLLGLYAGPYLEMENATATPGISLDEDLVIGLPTEFTLDFTGMELYNYGRTDMQLMLTATSPSPHVQFDKGTVEFTLPLDDTFVDITAPFEILVLNSAEPGGSVTVQVELSAPYMKESYIWEYEMPLGDTPLTGSFVTAWQTDMEGVSSDQQVRIPATGSSYTINWEDMMNPAVNGVETASGEHTITFPEPGLYKLSITGDIGSISFDEATAGSATDDAKKLRTLYEWGTISWTTMENMFRGAENLVIKAGDRPDLTNVTNMSGMLEGTRYATLNMGRWDLSGISDNGAGTGIRDLLNGSGMRIVDYDRTLKGWSEQANTPQGLVLDASGLQYCDSASRTMLTDEKGWTIEGDAMAEHCGAITMAEQDYGLGWNLVGMPVLREASEVTDLFPTAIRNTLYGFDGSYRPESALQEGTGYWLRMFDDYRVDHTGAGIDELETELLGSWNLISGISTTTTLIDPEDILVPGTLYEFNGSYEPAEMLDPGKGYWVATSGPGEIWMDPTPATPPSELAGDQHSSAATGSYGTHGSSNTRGSSIRAQMLEGYEETLSALQFQVGDRILQELLFDGSLPSDAHPLQWALPPLPPEGGFDVRFENGTWANDSKTVTIHLQQSDEPVTLTLASSDEYLVSMYAEGQRLETSSLREGVSVYVPRQTDQLMIIPASPANEELPQTAQLDQNYPNPFNPTTQIRFALPEGSSVSLEVFNMLGQKVATLADGAFTAGWHTVSVDAGSWSSGIYLYRLRTESGQVQRQMILVK